jgi:hypothetical protein
MTIDNISENGKSNNQPQTIFDLTAAPIDGKPREQHAEDMKRWLEALLDKDQIVELRALKVKAPIHETGLGFSIQTIWRRWLALRWI